MNNIAVLHPKIHGHLRIDNRDHTHSYHQQFIKVYPVEYQFLCADYPIFFVKNQSTGRFVSVVMTGFNPQENLFIDNGRWHTDYLPLEVQRGPFCYGFDAHQEPIMCVDTSHPNVQQNHGQWLFCNNKPTEYLLRAASILKTIHQGAEELDKFINQLLKYDLIERASLNITFADNTKRQLEKIYLLNHDALQSLIAQDTRRNINSADNREHFQFLADGLEFCDFTDYIEKLALSEANLGKLVAIKNQHIRHMNTKTL